MRISPFASRADVQIVPDAGYQAGVCNIGPAEIGRRRMAGRVGLVTAIATLAVLVMLDAPPLLRLAVLVPATLSAAGFLQARLRFCANYGWRGIFNLGDIGDAGQIADEVARAADRRLALQIGLGSLAIGLTAGIAAVILPI